MSVDCGSFLWAFCVLEILFFDGFCGKFLALFVCGEFFGSGLVLELCNYQFGD